MIIGSGKVYLHANWVHSLKEKRMVVKSILAKVKNKFNVSVAEVQDQDLHQSIVIGIVCVTNSTKQADSIIQNVINYIEENTEALVLNVETEII